MSVSEEGKASLVEQVDKALPGWRQGDVSRDTDIGFVNLANLSMPHSIAPVQASVRRKRETKQAVLASQLYPIGVSRAL